MCSRFCSHLVMHHTILMCVFYYARFLHRIKDMQPYLYSYVLGHMGCKTENIKYRLYLQGVGLEANVNRSLYCNQVKFVLNDMNGFNLSEKEISSRRYLLTPHFLQMKGLCILYFRYVLQCHRVYRISKGNVWRNSLII